MKFLDRFRKKKDTKTAEAIKNFKAQVKQMRKLGIEIPIASI